MKKGFLVLILALLSAPAYAVNKFVCDATDTGAGCTDGECWQNSYTSISRDWGAETNFTIGTDVVYICNEHAQSTGSAITVRGSSSASEAPIPILCVAGNATGTSPGAACSAGDLAQVSTSGTFDISIVEGLYLRGIEFFSGDDIFICNDITCRLTLELGRLELTGAFGADSITVSGSGGIDTIIRLKNVDFDFANVGQGLQIDHGEFIWEGGTLHSVQNNFLETITTRKARILISGVDLSILNGNLLQASTLGAGSRIEINRSVLHASTVILNGDIASPGVQVDAYYSAAGTSANPSIQMQADRFEGRTSVQTGRNREGGATDGTTEFSWLLDSTVGTLTSFYAPLRTPPLNFWLDGNGSTAHTIRFYIASGATQDNTEVWPVCETQTSASTSSLSEFTTGRPNPGVAATNWTTDSLSNWTCSSDCGTKQRMDIVVTPDKAGFARCWVEMAVDSEQIHLDARPAIDP